MDFQNTSPNHSITERYEIQLSTFALVPPLQKEERMEACLLGTRSLQDRHVYSCVHVEKPGPWMLLLSLEDFAPGTSVRQIQTRVEELARTYDMNKDIKTALTFATHYQAQVAEWGPKRTYPEMAYMTYGYFCYQRHGQLQDEDIHLKDAVTERWCLRYGSAENQVFLLRALHGEGVFFTKDPTEAQGCNTEYTARMDVNNALIGLWGDVCKRYPHCGLNVDQHPQAQNRLMHVKSEADLKLYEKRPVTEQDAMSLLEPSQLEGKYEHQISTDTHEDIQRYRLLMWPVFIKKAQTMMDRKKGRFAITPLIRKAMEQDLYGYWCMELTLQIVKQVGYGALYYMKYLMPPQLCGRNLDGTFCVHEQIPELTQYIIHMYEAGITDDFYLTEIALSFIYHLECEQPIRLARVRERVKASQHTWMSCECAVGLFAPLLRRKEINTLAGSLDFSMLTWILNEVAI